MSADPMYLEIAIHQAYNEISDPTSNKWLWCSSDREHLLQVIKSHYSKGPIFPWSDDFVLMSYVKYCRLSVKDKFLKGKNRAV